MKLPSLSPFVLALLVLAYCVAPSGLRAAEESEFDWPLGPIGGKFRIWTDAAYIRVTEVTPSAPGATAGLQVGDIFTGVFGQPFDTISASMFNGPVRQLGEAIDYAEINQTPLIVNIIRPGSGTLNLTIPLPATSGLSANYTATSARYAALYETACLALYTKIMSTANGDIGYPTGFAGLALLGHSQWNDLTGAKPYRLAINKVRDWASTRIHGAVLTPVEDTFFDGTPNPNYVANPVGLENWTLSQAVMFLAEYISKTGELTIYQPTLQRGAVLMANRIQNWAQPNNGGTADRSYERCRGASSHGGVTGDYTHTWYVGINITGVHMFNALAMAKRAGADMTERPKDGHYFGFALNPGDTIPATIAPALPSTIILPRGAEDLRALPHLDNTSNAPLTTITSVDASHNPWFYDCSLDQKFWLHWDCLTRSTNSAGWVGYAANIGAAWDAGARTAAALLGMKIYHNGAAFSALDQELADRQMRYHVNAHDIHLNSHAYNMGGACFAAMLMPYLTDRDQRYFLENWKFFYNLAAQPDGTLRYFRGRDFTDAYIHELDAMHTNIAIAGSVARGGLPSIPAFDSNRVMVRVRQPLMDWPTPEARRVRLPGGVNTTHFDLDVLDGHGTVIDPLLVTAVWSVVSGPVTSGLFLNPNSLDTTATFPQPGTYRLQLNASAGSYSTQESIDVVVLSAALPGYNIGEADYKVFTNISGSAVSNLTSATKYPDAPDLSRHLTQLEGTHSGDNYGSSITGVILPPVSGNYRFYIASNEHSQLWFNATGASAAGATLIADVTNGSTTARQWNKYATQQSVEIPLTAGHPYYFQALQKEGTGSDHLAIGWTTPNTNTISLIGTSHIARPNLAHPPAITTQPSNQVIALGDNVTFSLGVVGPEPRFFQWRRNGQPFGPVLNSPDLTVANASAHVHGTWDCIYTNGNSVLISQPATVTLTGFGQLATGGLWQEVYHNLAGSTVSDLLNHANFPSLPSSSGPLAQPATSSLGDDYGQRWSGWLIPSSSGRYRFYAAADDTTRLYLSPTQYEVHKQLIHTISSYSAEKEWSSRAPSAGFDLVAGQRYYVEFLHKEGGGGDHAAFTWHKEGDPVPVNGSDLILSANLQHAWGGTFPDGASAPPYASADTMVVAQGSSVSLDVVANDLDADPASLVVSAFSQPEHGSLTQNGHNFHYTPAPGFSGSDRFSYTIRNRLNLAASATVQISITSPWSGMTAWWKLDENTGTQVADATGNGHNATLSSGTAWTPGKLGSGISIASSTQMATTASNKPVPSTFTISAWMNPTNKNGIDTLLSFGNVAAFRCNNSGLRFTTFGVKDHDTASTMFSANTWTHVALTFIPNTQGGAKFYVNGVLRQSIDSSSLNTSSTGVWRIGAAHVTSEWFGGSLDDVRLYDRVLSEQDIASLATTPTPFELWRISKHNPTQLSNTLLSGPYADTDNDGIQHLMEYALDLNPLATDRLSHKISTDLVTFNNNQYHRIHIHKNPAATDLTYTVEVSPDMVSWSALPTLVEINTTTQLVVRDTLPTINNRMRFIRLHIKL